MLSLVMATVGRRDEVFRFVESLGAAASPLVELVVADQNIDDRLRALAQFCAVRGIRLRHLRLSEMNLSAARNAGIAAASGDVIGFPDDDCWYESGTVPSVVQLFSGRKDIDGVMTRWAERLCHDAPRSRLRFDRLVRFRGMPVASIGLFFRATVFDRLGGFDARFGVNQRYGSSEETEFVLRLLAAGATMEYRPEITVHHRWRTEPVPGELPISALWRTAAARARGTGAIYARHGSPAWTVWRGILAPVARAVRYAYRPRLAACQLATAAGRASGYWRWKTKETMP